MKIVFFGSSDFSIPALQACLESSYELSLVITTPDRKKGRGLHEQPTPVKIFCREHNLPVVSPESLKTSTALDDVKRMNPDIFVVSSYGKIIPNAWLEVPKIRFNVHPSLVPRYRGAAPINWAILNGDKETGISIMEINDRLDAGDVFYQKAVSLDPNMDAERLTSLLAEMSREALGLVLNSFSKGTLKGMAQDEAGAVYARKLEKEDGLIHWDCPAQRIDCQVRGLVPWPRAFFECIGGESVQVLAARVVDADRIGGRPAEILQILKDGAVQVQTGKGVLVLERLRPAGKKEMSGADYANGKRLRSGSILGAE
jgi:methionyl-tRNA formyltransferase